MHLQEIQFEICADFIKKCSDVSKAFGTQAFFNPECLHVHDILSNELITFITT